MYIYFIQCIFTLPNVLFINREVPSVIPLNLRGDQFNSPYLLLNIYQYSIVKCIGRCIHNDDTLMQCYTYVIEIIVGSTC